MHTKKPDSSSEQHNRLISEQGVALYQLRQVINELPGDVYWKDKKGNYLGMNNQGCESLQKMGFPYKEADIVGKTDYDLFDKETAARFRRNDLEVIETGQLQISEESAILPSGKKITQLSTKKPLLDENGEIVGVVGNTVDITKLKELQISLKKSNEKAEQANIAKSEFIANMSHDLRTPMTGISGMLEGLSYVAEDAKLALASKPSLEQITCHLQEFIARTDEYTDIAKESTQELLNLFNQILEAIQLESGQIDAPLPKGFNLRKLIQRSVLLLQSVAQHKKLDLTCEIDSAVPQYLSGISFYLERTLSNLISNALKFTKKGFVKISVGLQDNARTIKKSDSVSVIIKVEDSGIGIPHDKFTTIFEHLSRLSPSFEGVYKGSGLGLYTVKKYVEAMQGGISVESEVGEGSCFIVTLPLQVVSDLSYSELKTPKPEKLDLSFYSPEQPRKIRSEQIAESTATVLVVEDNAAAAMAVKLTLKRLHCYVDIAINAAEAVKKAQNWSYDLILMDVGLPDFSGIEAAKRIRALIDKAKADVPIVALTGHAGDAEKRQECLDARMQDVISKPAQPSVLDSVLQQLVWKRDNKESHVLAGNKNDYLEVNRLPTIDWDGSVAACAGNEDTARELLAILSDDLLDNTQPALESAYAKRDFKALFDELHRTIGGVVYLRLPELENALNQLKSIVKNSSHKTEALQVGYAEVKRAIKRFVKSLSKLG